MIKRLIFALWLCLSAFPALSQWWDTDYSNRVKITVDADSSVTDTDWLYYYPLSEMPASFWSIVQSDGDDIRVTSGNDDTQVPAYVTGFDNVAEIGALYFKAGASATADSTFYIYYGNGTATKPTDGSTYGKFAVFDQFDYFYTMEGAEDGSEGVKNHVEDDSHVTPRQTKTGDAVAGLFEHDAYQTDGKNYWDTGARNCGACDLADNTNDAAHFVQTAALPLTVSFWIHFDSVLHKMTTDHGTWSSGTVNNVVGSYYSSTGLRSWLIQFHAYNTNPSSPAGTNANYGIRTLKYNTSNTADFNMKTLAPQGDTIPNEEWIHIAFTLTSSGVGKLYYNGDSINSETEGNGTIQTTTSTNSKPTLMGWARSSYTPDQIPFGKSQDIFINYGNFLWTTEMFSAYYAMCKTPNTFYSTGAEESNGGGATRRIINVN